jgi:hypothetical protein
MDFTIKLTGEQLDIIGNALGQRPYAEVFELISELHMQVREQQKPADPPVVDIPV